MSCVAPAKPTKTANAATIPRFTVGSPPAPMISPGPRMTARGFPGFVLTDEEGTRYVFESPTLATYTGIHHSTDEPILVITKEHYVNTWRLVAILARDYKGDVIPNAQSRGSWIKLEYSDVQTATLTTSSPRYTGCSGTTLRPRRATASPRSCAGAPRASTSSNARHGMLSRPFATRRPSGGAFRPTIRSGRSPFTWSTASGERLH